MKQWQKRPLGIKEIDEWGANLAKLDNGKFDKDFWSTYIQKNMLLRRLTGLSIQNALLRKAKEIKIEIFDSEYDLLVEEQTCFGAVSFNIKSGERTVHLSDAVILCTGGHTQIWKRVHLEEKKITGMVCI